MGMHWGNMRNNVRGIIIYSLSPYELKAFGGAFSKGVPNMVRRMKDQIFRVVPPFIVGYLVYDWAVKEGKRLLLKDPNDYINDE